MKFTYEHPALVRCLPPGCRTLKSAFVIVRDEADIPEIAEEEAPVACEFRFAEPGHVYRYRDGGFYVAAGRCEVSVTGAWTLPEKASIGLEQALKMDVDVGIGGHGADIWPALARQHVAYVSSFRSWLAPLTGDTLRDYDADDFAREYGRKTAYRLEELDEIDGGDLDLWSERARRLTEAAFVLDGKVWWRVAEPIIRLLDSDTLLQDFCDMDLFDRRKSRFFSHPRPFGQSTLWSNARYWDRDSSSFPFSELDRAIELMRASPRSLRGHSFDSRLAALSDSVVLMPEVFGHGHAALELDRRARVAIAEEWRAGVRGNRAVDLKPLMEKSCRRIRRFLDAASDDEVVVEGLDDALEAYAALLPSDTSELWQYHRRAIGEAVSAWRSRPIGLDIGGKPPVSSRGMMP